MRAAPFQSQQAGDSDALLRLAVDASAIATWDVDLTTGEAIWSENHFRLFGIPVHPGKRASREMWLAHIHPEDRERAKATFERAMKERTLYRCEYRVVRADDGQIVWVEPRGRFFYDGSRRAVRAVGVLFEITARKQAEERLIQRETQLDLAARLVGIGVFEHDHVNERLYWSDLLREIHEIPPEVAPHIGAFDGQVHPEDAESLTAAVKAAHDPAGEGKFSLEYRILRRNGETRWIVGRAQTFFAGEGAQRHVVRTVGAEYDVTNRKRIEMDLRADRENLRRAEAALREADRRKDEFLATLAHELRNPLAPIRNAAHMLTLPKLAEEQLQWARRVIHRQVQHMARLLDDLLDVARITRGKLQLKKEHVDFGTIVDTAVETARPLINAKKHGLTLELPPQLPTLEADPVRLAQVLSNLLTNAAKYTDESGRIALRAWVDNDRLCISVRDNGIGLSSAALPHMFQMFSQVHDDQDRSGGGLGIGLALVKGLIDLHGGTIEAHSDGPGCGSEFVVTIPIQDGSVLLANDTTPTLRVDASTARKILVVDDNQDAADSLALLLEALGHTVRTAHGGHSAVALAQDFQPDVALLDIGMPDMSGYEVAQQLRETQWGTNIRLIALTGWGQDEDKRRALAAGFDHHLTKPVELQELEKLLLASGGRLSPAR